MCVEDFNEIAALDLALTTNAVNIDYKKSLHDWNIKTVNGSFRIILQIQLQG
jgi:iron complex outermembrane receptor protein